MSPWAYQRGSAWYIAFRDAEGRLRRIRVSANTKTEAKRKAEEAAAIARDERLGLRAAPAKPMSVRELAGKYFETVTRHQKSWKSTKGRLDVICADVLADELISRVRPVDVEEFLGRLRDAGYAKGSLHHFRTHLNAMFRFAIERLQVLRAPGPMIHVPRVKVPRQVPRALTREQLARLLDAAKGDRLLLMMASLSGLRRGELAGLRWSDVDIPNRMMLVARSYDSDTTKGGRVRPVAIHLALVPELEAAKRAAKSELVFPGRSGHVRNRSFNAGRKLRVALKAAGLVAGYRLTCRRSGCGHVEECPLKASRPCPRCGFALWPVAVPLPFRFKDLRSTFGTLAYEATGNIRYVSEQLGHSDVRITQQHYAHQRAQHLLDETDKIHLSTTQTAHKNTGAATGSEGSDENA